MFKIILSPADREIRVSDTFCTARKVPAVDIHRQICDVHIQPNSIIDSVVRSWVRQFKDSLMNVHDEPRSGRPYNLITNNLVTAVEVKVRG